MAQQSIMKYYFNKINCDNGIDPNSTSGNVLGKKQYFFTRSEIVNESLSPNESHDDVEITKEDMKKFHQKAFETSCI